MEKPRVRRNLSKNQENSVHIFQRLTREKSNNTKNQYQVITHNSDSDSKDEIDKIVKKLKKEAKFRPLDLYEATTTNHTNILQDMPSKESKIAKSTPVTVKNKNKTKIFMPPIIEGKTNNQNKIFQYRRVLIKGEFII